ncbi:MAG: carboxypeptidase regulatory-like domain-containing protein [Gemmatimonadaceae bacterium]
MSSTHRARVMRALSLLIALALSAAFSSAIAQIGSSTDIVTGIVRREANAPVEGAQVEVTSLESNITRRARTNAQGRFTVLFPDGGGQYRVRVRALGLAPQEVMVVRQSDEDRLVAEIQMTATATQIAGVTVRARQDVPRDLERPTPGSTERMMTTDQAARLPIDPSDLLSLALTTPGVVSIPGNDTTPNAISIAGLSPGANNITLDGLSFGVAQVPQEAVRSTRVITSSYDAGRGQFSGGLISSTTRSGTNTMQGNFSYALRDRELAIEGEDPSPATQGFTQNQLSGGLGGPLVRDRLFWFGSLQLRRRDDVVPSLANADGETLTRFGVNPDSVTRFTNLLSQAGVAPFAIAADDRLSDNASGIVRLDYLTEGGQSISLRSDFRWSDTDPSRIGPLSLPQTGGSNRNWGGGIAASLTSNVGGRFLNELKVYGATDRRTGRPLLVMPAGRVQVASQLDGGETGIATLTFGGNSGLPQDGETKSLEATNEVSWLTDDGAHRFKLGALLNVSQFTEDVTTNRWGTFTFNSLADFESGRAAMFTRTLAPRLREGAGTNASLYLGDVWRTSRSLQVIFGLRAEGSRFGKTPEYNPAVEQSFGYRTDHVPTEFHLSPRVGFTWTLGLPQLAGRPGGVGDADPAKRRAVPAGGLRAPWLIVRGGIGEFRSAPSTQLVAAAAGATGLPNNESQLVCIGSGVPAANWAQFVTNPASVPTQCATGQPSQVPTTLPNVAVFGDDFAAPRAWRASLGASRPLRQRYNLNVELSYARGVAQTGYRDVNLSADPRFTLASEGNRPVFVDAATIVPTTGATSFLASRLNPSFGQVLVTSSDTKSDSKQLSVSLSGLTSRGAIFNVSYTLARSKDQGSGSGFGRFGGGGGFGGLGGATTSGNPNVREWSTSDFERRHSFVGSVTWPFGQGLEITAFGRMSSGAPFTPLVGADINGDGARNDRAFLFDPGSAGDPGGTVAAGMQRLLASAPNVVRDCLSDQLGRVAQRNSCTGVWQPSLDFQLNWRPNLWGLNRRLAISVATVNTLGGLDELLHGSNNLRGWGQFRGQDNTLLYVRGFDPASQSYRYEVNERFAAARNGANGIRVPFQLGINARYTLGPDRMRDMIQAMRGGMGGGGGPGGGRGAGGFPGGLGGAGGGARAMGPEGIADMAAVANPVNALIQLKDSLALTEEQLAKLKPLSDSLAARNATLGAEARKVVQDAGANPDMGAMFARIRPILEKIQKSNVDAMRDVEKVLTSDQWAKVPERIKRGQMPGMGQQRRPPEGVGA